jgi:DMSO/TMAO reductase YedYZ molybdopterin-dependent catalytic subunit
MVLSRRQLALRFASLPAWRALETARAMLAQAPALEVGTFEPPSLGTLLTSNDDFFVRSHFSVPRFAPHSWRLKVTGCIRSGFDLRYEDLMRLQRHKLMVTIECAGNGAGMGEVGTGTWTGISLAALLKEAGLPVGAKQIRLVGADCGIDDPSRPAVTYMRSIPLQKALHQDTLLAFRMNDGPLSAEHGYPLRALVPGWYGMDCVKWLVRVEVLDHEDESYFMTERYVATRLQAVGSERLTITGMRVKAVIVQPRDGEVRASGVCTVSGFAWAGENKVAQVELSLNGGRDWTLAALTENAHPYCWVPWKYIWAPKGVGTFDIVARATDNHGNVQPENQDPARIDSYELNSYHSVRCVIR